MTGQTPFYVLTFKMISAAWLRVVKPKRTKIIALTNHSRHKKHNLHVIAAQRKCRISKALISLQVGCKCGRVFLTNHRTSLLRRGLFRLSGSLRNGPWGEENEARELGRRETKTRGPFPSFPARPRFFNFPVFSHAFLYFLAVSPLKERLGRREPQNAKAARLWLSIENRSI